MQSKIAIIGEKASVMGFSSIGFEVCQTDVPDEVEKLVAKMVSEKYGVIFITEQVLDKIPDLINRYKTQRIPAIIPIPGIDGSLGIGMENVRKNVERAVGADILFNND